MQTKIIPKNLQAVLWSADINKLDLDRDRGYIIHQIFCYSTVDDLRWLFSVYTKEELIDEFVNNPTKMYPRAVFYFVKNYLLGLKDTSLDEHDYITSIHGTIRPRTVNQKFTTSSRYDFT